MGKASRRKAEKHSPQLTQMLNRAVKKLGVDKSTKIRTDLPQHEKISHPLSILLKAEIREDSTLTEYKNALNFIVAAWNISQFEIEERPKAINEIVNSLHPKNKSIQSDMTNYLETLVKKRLTLFPNDERVIVDCDVGFEGNSFRLSAVAFSPEHPL